MSRGAPGEDGALHLLHSPPASFYHQEARGFSPSVIPGQVGDHLDTSALHSVRYPAGVNLISLPFRRYETLRALRLYRLNEGINIKCLICGHF